MAQKPLSTHDMDRELDALARREAAALHQPMVADGMHRKLSDEELVARGEIDVLGRFDVPEEIVPDGFVYQWFRYEVYGQPDIDKSCMMAERNGWRSVPASRHPGRWHPESYDGPIEEGGQRLMELPATESYNRQRYGYLKARVQRQAGRERLGSAPPGTGPRSHPGVRPQVSVTRETMAVET